MTPNRKVTSPKLIVWIGRLQFIAVTITVLTFLGFVFADNIANRWWQTSLRREMTAQGLDAAQMAPRPLVGFSSMHVAAGPDALTGAVYSPEHDVVWLTDETGRLWQFDVSAGTFTEQLQDRRLASAAAVAVMPEGDLLVAVPEARSIVRITANATGNAVIDEHPLDAGSAPHYIAVDSNGSVYFLDDANPTELTAWHHTAAPYVLFARPGLRAVASHGGRLILTGDVLQGRPLVHLSKNGVDITDTTDPSRLWALPYWDVPFVDVAVDDDGFVTLLDANGHIIQMDPNGTALLQLPPREGHDASARSLAMLPTGILVVYDDAVELLHVNREGTVAAHAVLADSTADYKKSIHLWHELLSADPHLGVARRLLGDAYLADGHSAEAARQYFYAGQRPAFNEAVKAHTKQLRQDVLWTPLLVLGLASVVLSVLKLLLTTEANGESN